MPTVAVTRDYLLRLIEQPNSTQEDFENLCFEFGIELDEVTSERRIFEKEHASGLADPAQRPSLLKEMAELSDAELYKIDTPANRYDLLSPESMALALRVFLGTLPAPVFRVLPPQTSMLVRSSTRNIRDFVICAVLRDVTFTAERYQSFVDFQTKLHNGLARKRTLCSVGTHDLDSVKGTEFIYECTPKDQVKFTPLKHPGTTLDCTGEGLHTFYEQDRHINKFTPLLAGLEKYPVIRDAATNSIMSLPPIINSEMSKMTQDTKNVFIECTAPEYAKAACLVNQLVCAFSWYCKEPFTVEAVNVKYEDPTALNATRKMLHQSAIDAATFRGDTVTLKELEKTAPASDNVDVTPDMRTRAMQMDVPEMNRKIGIDVDAPTCAKLLTKMMLPAQVVDAKTVRVDVPVNRSDVLHPADLIEDCAIAYGYDNITYEPVPTSSAGSQTPMNKLAHLLRLEVAAAGYTEMLTFSLCSKDEAFKFLRRDDAAPTAVEIGNPKTTEFEVCRPSLLPGTLKTLQANRSQPLPIKLFEISDVVNQDAESRTLTKNARHFAALHAQTESSGFDSIHGLTEYVLRKIGVPQKPFHTPVAEFEVQLGGRETAAYYFFRAVPGDQGPFFPGRAMEVVLRTPANGEQVIGALGVLHPKVLRSKALIHKSSPIDILTPCSYVELNLEPVQAF